MQDKKKTLSRRQLLKLSAFGAGALGLAACGAPEAPKQAEAPKQEAPKAEAPKPTEAPKAAAAAFEFLAWGDNADIPAWDKLVAMYKEKNSAATITITPVAEPNKNYYPKLQTMIAGGTPPAVASFQGWEWQPYADQNVLAPIDDLVKANSYFNDVYPANVNGIAGTTERNGKRFLIPLQRATMVMFYAKKPFQEAGVEFPKDDWTFDQFLEISAKLTNKDKKIFGHQANGGWFRDIGWIRGTGKQEFDNLYDPKKSMFNQPEIVDIVQRIANDWYNKDKFAPTPADQQGGANTINTGNCATKYEGPWFFGALNSEKLRTDKKNVPFDVVLMPKMADAERPHRGWTEGVALLKGDNVNAAWDFASFMAGEEGCKTYSSVTGRMPNTTKLIESFWLPNIEKQFEVKNGKAFVEAFNRSEVDVVGKVPRSKMWSEVVKPMAWDPLMAGKATAAEVLPKVDAAIQKMLDEAYK
jgi:multiple sugar transport system substrate-binding protein